MGRDAFPARNSWHTGAVPSLNSRISKGGWRSHEPSGCSLSADRPSRIQASNRRTNPNGYRHADGVRSRPSAFGTGGGARRDRRHSRVAGTRRDLLAARPSSRCRIYGRYAATPVGIQAPWGPAGATPAALWSIHPFDHDGLRGPGHESIRTAPGSGQRYKTNRTAYDQQRLRQAWLAQRGYYL